MSNKSGQFLAYTFHLLRRMSWLHAFPVHLATGAPGDLINSPPYAAKIRERA